MKLGLNKRGVNIGEIPSIAIFMGIAVIASAIMTMVVSKVQDTTPAPVTESNESYAYNISEYGLQGFLTFSQWFGTIFIIIAAVIVIALLFKIRTGGSV